MNQLLIACSLICLILYAYMVMGTSQSTTCKSLPNDNPPYQTNNFFSRPSYYEQQYGILEKNW